MPLPNPNLGVHVNNLFWPGFISLQSQILQRMRQDDSKFKDSWDYKVRFELRI